MAEWFKAPVLKRDCLRIPNVQIVRNSLVLFEDSWSTKRVEYRLVSGCFRQFGSKNGSKRLASTGEARRQNCARSIRQAFNVVGCVIRLRLSGNPIPPTPRRSVLEA